MRIVTQALIVAALAFGAGCAQKDWIDRTLVTVDVTGYWVLSPDEVLWFELKQEGAKVTGSYGWTGWYANQERGGPLEGTLNGDALQFKQVGGGSLEGEMIVNGDEMSGRIQTQRFVSVRSFRRVVPSSQQGQPTR
jgi:hypothetical protein